MKIADEITDGFLRTELVAESLDALNKYKDAFVELVKALDPSVQADALTARLAMLDSAYAAERAHIEFKFAELAGRPKR